MGKAHPPQYCDGDPTCMICHTDPRVKCVCNDFPSDFYSSSEAGEAAIVDKDRWKTIDTWDQNRIGEFSGPAAPGENGQYSSLSPQPIDVIESWGLDFHEAQVLKYLARYKRKGGSEDLRKARWYLERLIDRTNSR